MGNGYVQTLIEELGDDFMNKWSYAGGNRGKRHKNYFELFNKEKKLEEPEPTDRCACGHKIVENCYIYNKELNELRILGSCCIKKFLNESNRGRTCKDCGSSHRNRKVNYCNDCRFKYCENCAKKKNNNYKYCFPCYMNLNDQSNR